VAVRDVGGEQGNGEMRKARDVNVRSCKTVLYRKVWALGWSAFVTRGSGDTFQHHVARIDLIGLTSARIKMLDLKHHFTRYFREL
jgi:hypothetical protein